MATFFTTDFATNYASDLGSDWVIDGGTWRADSGFAENMSTDGTNAWAYLAVSPSASQYDQDVTAVINFPTGTDYAGIVARGGAGGNFSEDGYCAQVNILSTDVRLYRRTAGAWTEIGTRWEGSTAVTANVDHTLRLKVTGNGASVAIEVWFDGVQRITFSDTDANRKLSGNCGLYSAQTNTKFSSFLVDVPASGTAPTVTNVSPNTGDVDGGDTVTITGTNFVSGAVAKFGGTNALSTTFVSSTQLTAVTPQKFGGGGAVSVSVTNPNAEVGNLSNGFTYNTPPFKHVIDAGAADALTLPSQRHFLRFDPGGGSAFYMAALQLEWGGGGKQLAWYRSNDEGQTWAFFANINTADHKDRADLLAVGNNIAVAYGLENSVTDTPSADHDVYFQWWNYNSGTRNHEAQAAVKVFEASSTEAYFRQQMAIDSTGKIWITAAKLEADGTYSLVCAVSTNNGASWTRLTDFENGIPAPYQPGGILVHLGTKVIALWNRSQWGPAANQKIHNDSDPVDTWSATTNPFTPGMYHGAACSAVADGSGGMHFFYKTNTIEDFMYRYFDGTTWGSPVNCEPDGEAMMQMATCLVGGTCYLFYDHYLSSDRYSLRYRTVTGGVVSDYTEIDSLSLARYYLNAPANLPTSMTYVPVFWCNKTPNWDADIVMSTVARSAAVAAAEPFTAAATFGPVNVPSATVVPADPLEAAATLGPVFVTQTTGYWNEPEPPAGPQTYAGFFLCSKSSVVQLELLEITHPNFSKPYRIVRNAVEGVTATIDGVATLFDYYPLRITSTGSRDNLDSSFRIDVGDLGEIIPVELDLVAAGDGFQTNPTVRYWTFRSDDLSKPLLGPFLLEVQTFAFTKEGASFEAKAPSLNVSRTGERYDLNRFKTLRGFL